jgi:hypothetical protein
MHEDKNGFNFIIYNFALTNSLEKFREKLLMRFHEITDFFFRDVKNCTFLSLEFIIK